MPNRLASETSPYLRQHRDNPVDWYPWSSEALARARAENKPILLSIGYSACHWCHVMEHESFENDEIARLMNEHFINIKVDREERPDLDHIYQNVAQALTRGGGWPLTVFLTPDLRPFYGGTYFPPDDRHGRPGFARVLKTLSEAFRNDERSVAENAHRLTEFIQAVEQVPAPEKATPIRITLDGLKEISQELLGHVDRENGGLGGAPKFPNPMLFSFLWRLGVSTSSGDAKEATILSLEKMAKGGIYDHLGGGFHRYSVDAAWSIPHFEKMLYDNALLLKLYSEVVLVPNASVRPDQRHLFVQVIRETVNYLLREMISPEGAFYSAQDADSEGEEGKFFVWDRADLEREKLNGLADEELRVFALRYGVRDGGNFEHGKTVLAIALSIHEVAEQSGFAEEHVRRLLNSARVKLLEARGNRVAPARDDKILTAWNALAVSGLAWAGRALEVAGEAGEGHRALTAARRAFDFLKTHLSQHDGRAGRLFSSFQKGQPKLNAYLDDYAFMAMAALDLARFSADQEDAADYLALAETWVGTVLDHFKDSKGVGYYFTSDDHETLLQRPKTLFDQAIPSGTAVVLGCLAALAEMGLPGRSDRYLAEMESQFVPLFAIAQKSPYGLGELLGVALLDVLGVVTVSGPGAGSASRHPHVFQSAVRGERKSELVVCHDQACSLPLPNPEEAWGEAYRRLNSLKH